MSSIEQLHCSAVYGWGKPVHRHGAGRELTVLSHWHGRFAVLILSAIAAYTAITGQQRPASAAIFGTARTGRAARQEAIRAIPFDRLKPEVRERIAAVVTEPSVYRRMPVKVIDCDPSLYLLLVRNPEIVVSIWDLMGITRIQLQRTGPFTFAVSDGMGTTCKVELVYGTHRTHLVYGEGDYDGSLLRKPVRGRCVLLLKSGYVETANGRVHVTNRLDLFLHLDHVAVDVLAKTVHPLFGRIADLNFVQTVGFLERISRTAERNAPGMRRLANRLTHVDQTVRHRFEQLAANVNERSMERLASQRGVITSSTGPATAGR